MADSRFLCNLRYRDRIVPGDYFHFHSPLGKVTECIHCPLPDCIVEQDKCNGSCIFCQFFSIQIPLILCKYKHTISLFQKYFDCSLNSRIILPQHKFRCTDHISFSCQNHSAVFCGRRKRDDFFCTVFHRLRKILLQCLHRCIVARQGTHTVREQLCNFIFVFRLLVCFLFFRCQALVFCKDKLCHFHFWHGNGSGLIHAQYIYPRQCLDTFHVMDQYLLFSKPHHRHHHRHTCKKVQAFRDHSENSRHHARHTIFHRCPGKKVLL